MLSDSELEKLSPDVDTLSSLSSFDNVFGDVSCLPPCKSSFEPKLSTLVDDGSLTAEKYLRTV